MDHVHKTHKTATHLFGPIKKYVPDPLKFKKHPHESPQVPQIEQKIIVKVSGMIDEKAKQKAIETIASIHGVDAIAADLKDQKITIIGKVDIVEVSTKLRKFGYVEIVSVGPAKEEKKDDKKK